MTQSISKAQKGLVSQIIKLRKLTQPYFLPYTKTNGWLFLYLLIALLFCVGGTVLFLLTGLMSLLTSFAPDITTQFLGGVQNSLKVIWTLDQTLPAVHSFDKQLISTLPIPMTIKTLLGFG